MIAADAAAKGGYYILEKIDDGMIEKETMCVKCFINIFIIISPLQPFFRCLLCLKFFLLLSPSGRKRRRFPPFIL